MRVRDRTVDTLGYRSVCSYDDSHWLIRHFVALPNVRRVGHRVRNLEPLHESPTVLDGVVVRHPDEHDVSIMLLSQLVEVGLLPLALRSPRLPEVENDRRPTLLPQRKRRPRERFHREVGSLVGGAFGARARASTGDSEKQGRCNEGYPSHCPGSRLDLHRL